MIALILQNDLVTEPSVWNMIVTSSWVAKIVLLILVFQSVVSWAIIIRLGLPAVITPFVSPGRIATNTRRRPRHLGGCRDVRPGRRGVTVGEGFARCAVTQEAAC